jgi:hypothetical protein
VNSAFRKISRVGSVTGGTKWYLSEDCLLAAKRVMYAVEYRRFYLRDLESIVVWPTRGWLWRMGIIGVLFAGLSAAFWQWSPTTGAIFGGWGLAWVAVELAMGPTAAARICITGAVVEMPLVSRARRTRKVLGKIDAAVHAARGGVVEQPVAPLTGSQPPEPATPQTNFEAPSAAVSIADATQTNGS